MQINSGKNPSSIAIKKPYIHKQSAPNNLSPILRSIAPARAPPPGPLERRGRAARRRGVSTVAVRWGAGAAATLVVPLSPPRLRRRVPFIVIAAVRWPIHVPLVPPIPLPPARRRRRRRRRHRRWHVVVGGGLGGLVDRVGGHVHHLCHERSPRNFRFCSEYERVELDL